MNRSFLSFYLRSIFPMFPSRSCTVLPHRKHCEGSVKVREGRQGANRGCVMETGHNVHLRVFPQRGKELGYWYTSCHLSMVEGCAWGTAQLALLACAPMARNQARELQPSSVGSLLHPGVGAESGRQDNWGVWCTLLEKGLGSLTFVLYSEI